MEGSSSGAAEDPLMQGSSLRRTEKAILHSDKSKSSILREYDALAILKVKVPAVAKKFEADAQA